MYILASVGCKASCQVAGLGHEASDVFFAAAKVVVYPGHAGGLLGLHLWRIPAQQPGWPPEWQLRPHKAAFTEN